MTYTKILTDNSKYNASLKVVLYLRSNDIETFHCPETLADFNCPST